MNAHIDDSALAGAYLSLAQIFSYPTPETWRQLEERGLVDPALDQQAVEADYLAAFELGRGSAAVPLFEGMHRGDHGREGILEDLLRFYEFFDVKLSETDRDYPDHLVTELEFLAWLCRQEQAAKRVGRDAAPFLHAQRDFLDRHLAAWLPALGRKLDATNTVYAQYGAALRELVEFHRDHLGRQLQDSGDIK